MGHFASFIGVWQKIRLSFHEAMGEGSRLPLEGKLITVPYSTAVPASPSLGLFGNYCEFPAGVLYARRTSTLSRSSIDFCKENSACEIIIH